MDRDYSRLTEAGSGEQETFSQKSKLSVLNVERDWLDCDTLKYAAEMSMRHAVLTSEEFAPQCYLGGGVGSATQAAEAELLAEMLAWLPERYQVWNTPLNVATVATFFCTLWSVLKACVWCFGRSGSGWSGAQTARRRSSTR